MRCLPWLAGLAALILSWQTPNPALHVSIYRREPPAPHYTLVEIKQGASWEDASTQRCRPGAVPDACPTYCYRLRWFDQGGEGEVWSAEICGQDVEGQSNVLSIR
jgi:hypothetical protein